MKGIDKGIRATNYLVDQTIILIIALTVLAIFQEVTTSPILYYVICFLYYFLCEVITGQTLGKKLTKTRVVNNEGRRASKLRIFLRSILRLIPLDPLSYLYGTEYGIHDVLSSTRILKGEASLILKD